MKWRMLIISYLGMMAMTVTMQALPPVSFAIKDILQIDYASLGFLVGVISIPGIFLALPGGYLADKWGYRPVLYSGFIFMILGSAFFALGRNYAFLNGSRMLAGLGCILLSVTLPAVFTPYFQGKQLGTAMGIFNTALPVASIITFSFFAALGKALGWFNVFWIPVVYSGLVLLLALFFFPREKEKSTKVSQKQERHLPEGKNIWVLALIVLFVNMATMGYVAIAPTLYQKMGMSSGVIGSMLSANFWGAILLAMPIGYLCSQKKRAKVLIIAGCVLQGLALALVPIAGNYLPLVLILFAISSGPLMTPVYILVSSSLPWQQLNTGYGIIMSMMMMGCFAGPYLAGIVVDQLGGFNQSFAALGLFSILAAGTALAYSSQD